MKTIVLIVSCLFSVAGASQNSLVWEQTFGGGMYDFARQVEFTSDGGLISIGHTQSSDGDVSLNQGGGDVWLIKTTSNGAIEWEQTFGGSAFDYGSSVVQTSDGGFVAAGYSESTDGNVTGNHGNGDIWIIKVSNTGSLIWEKTFGGSLRETAQSIQQTSDGGFIVCGYSESVNGDITSGSESGEVWIIKLNNSGLLMWEHSYGGSAYESGQDIKLCSDGGFLFTGITHSNDGDVSGLNGTGNCWVVKTDSMGAIKWEHTYGGSNFDFGQSLENTNDGGFILAGYSESTDGDVHGNHGAGDGWMVKCDVNGNIQWEKTLGSSGNDQVYSVVELPGSGYALTGFSGYGDGDVSMNKGSLDCWMVILNSDGSIKTQQSFGGSGLDLGYCIRRASDGTLVIAGYSESADGDIAGNNGGGDSWILGLDVNTVSVKEESITSALKVWPNPGNGNYTFSGIEDGGLLRISDVRGQFIFSKTLDENEYNLDISNHSAGLYFYQLIRKNGAVSEGKLILN
ncbi:MAG: T9SS type A sorting domain-containing protein [Bacteroidota bacterium]|nr:T9SS type A sorting domain-containing protein [Bacteroidota bacterium]